MQRLRFELARSIRERLRRETAAEHEALERRLDLDPAVLSVARYRCVLQAFFGFYEPLEDRVQSQAAATVPALPFELRARAELLARDLVALGLSRADVARLPRCGDPPAVRCAAQLAGCLYVLEGASLGGQVIARALARHADPQLRRATAFFAGDGARTGPRFRCVVAWLEQLALAGTPGDDVVDAARTTFDSFAHWLQSTGAGR